MIERNLTPTLEKARRLRKKSDKLFVGGAALFALGLAAFITGDTKQMDSDNLNVALVVSGTTLITAGAITTGFASVDSNNSRYIERIIAANQKEESTK